MTTESSSEHDRMSTGPSPSRTSTHKCGQCKSRQDNARNLVVCIDGTSNKFGQNNTNVVKLFANIKLDSKDPEQCAYYSSGIGARPESLHILERLGRAVSDKFDMAIAWNLEEIVKDAYTWIAQTYKEGDQIYLFGFSRGAYQVRVLAAMIHEVGLIRTPTKKQIGMAYGRYEAIRSGKAKARQDANEFKNTFSWKDVKVHFIGVWDTVSSVGLIKGDIFLSTSTSAAHACHFRHALALDEYRVKFMPEYFHEMNSLTKGKGGMCKYSVPSPVVGDAANSVRKQPTSSDEGTVVSEDMEIPDVKEVWFAGSHSDVGGTSKPGTPHQAGNVSLLWMRREAIASGLVLKPTDIVWVPDDVDFGTSDSMTWGWKIIEHVPVTHQVSFSGAGENDRRRHRLQPRRIIPGQKVHASILYANAYQPRAMLGEGFDIPITHAENADTEMLDDLWETGLFDDTAAEALVNYLGKGVAPIYLDRLLFMLGFEEGRRYVRKVGSWEEKFTNVMDDNECASLVRLVTIVAYYEVSPTPPEGEFAIRISKDAKKCFDDILVARKPQDCPRVVALLRPLTKHQELRKCILTPDILHRLVQLLDEIVESVEKAEGNFAQAMDGLNCLLQCECTQQTLIDNLGAIPSNSNVPRLSRILEVNKPRLLIAVLRMMLTLARIPAARAVCAIVKHRVKALSRSKERLVGHLAVEIFLALYEPKHDEKNIRGAHVLDRLKIRCANVLKQLKGCDAPERLNIRNAQVRANLASALVCLNPDRPGSNDREDVGVDQLHRLFGLGATQLEESQKKLIQKLKKAVRNGNAQERTAATMTLLKLCETEAIRTNLREIGLLNVFIDQLQHKDKALLAAHALVACLKYGDMKEFIKGNVLLPEHIIKMLRKGYFDDAIRSVEGFQIFGYLMGDAGLWKEIETYLNTKNRNESMSRIIEVLNKKLGEGKPRETRRSLICLDIFLSIDKGVPWTGELVEKSLQHLRSQEWETQKAGIAILSALAQTEHGVAAIKPKIPDIIDMLLLRDYQRTASRTDGAGQPPEGEGRSEATNCWSPLWMMRRVRSFRILARNSESTDHRSSSQMMGPAWTLREAIQEKTDPKGRYTELKDLYQSGMLVGDTDTSAWRIKTPNRADVAFTLEQMIKIVDGELSEEGLMSVRDTMLPHIEHRDRLVTLLCDGAMEGVVLLPALVVAMIVGIPSGAVLMSIHLSGQVYWWARSSYQDLKSHSIWNRLRRKSDREGGRGTKAAYRVPGEQDSDGPSTGGGGSKVNVVATREPPVHDGEGTVEVTRQE